jgi:hypothetical protein
MKLSWKQRLLGTVELPAPPTPASTTIGSWNGMTHTQWLSSPDHIHYARTLFTQPLFRDLLAVLTNSRPRPVVRGITDTEAAVLLGIQQGYDTLLGLLLSLPTLPHEQPEEVPATYGAEELLKQI